MIPPEAVATWAANSEGRNEKSFIDNAQRSMPLSFDPQPH